VWLGHARGSSESLVGTKDGVVRAWTIRRMPEGERWGPEAITEMQGAPARPNTVLPGIHIPIAINIEANNSEGFQRRLLRDKRNNGPGEYISKLKTLKFTDIPKGAMDAPD